MKEEQGAKAGVCVMTDCGTKFERNGAYADNAQHALSRVFQRHCLSKPLSTLFEVLGRT